MAYAEVDSLLQHNKISYSAAEAHGLATGMLCANQDTGIEPWLKELTEGLSIPSEQRDILIKFFTITQNNLASDNYSFTLFLPSDEAPLDKQAEALKNWCQGFLFGLSLTGKTHFKKLQVGQEILKDISEFTKLESQVHGEEDEQALTEITEYLRSAVLLLRDEMNQRYH